MIHTEYRNTGYQMVQYSYEYFSSTSVQVSGRHRERDFQNTKYCTRTSHQ